MREGGFEYESFQRLLARNIPVERLDAAAIHRRFEPWREGFHRDGYFNPVGGWVESGRHVEALISHARMAGILLTESATIESWIERGGRVVGARTRDGREFEADIVVCAMGAWSPYLVPELGASVRSTGTRVFLLRPNDAVRARFAAPEFSNT